MVRSSAKPEKKLATRNRVFFIIACIFIMFFGGTFVYVLNYSSLFQNEYFPPPPPPVPPRVNKVLYDLKLRALAHVASTTPIGYFAGTPASSTTPATPARLWPVKAGYPNAGALLPFKRIVAYYGNFNSTKMGVLGEYAPDIMLGKLMDEVAKWQAADPDTAVVPALDYIAVIAQGSAGADGMYRLRMSDAQIQRAVNLAETVHGLVFLDIQIGLSSLKAELPELEAFLKLPNVHLAIDPEFAMKTKAKPGTVIGTFDATDVNYAAEFLARIVREYNLPPKMLVVHRFTRPMVTNYQLIRPLREVQIIIDMDGWGYPENKLKTYQAIVHNEPVQFTGFKLFYKNDLRAPSTRMMTPEEILKLTPSPSYIQYQ